MSACTAALLSFHSGFESLLWSVEAAGTFCLGISSGLNFEGTGGTIWSQSSECKTYSLLVYYPAGGGASLTKSMTTDADSWASRFTILGGEGEPAGECISFDEDAKAGFFGDDFGSLAPPIYNFLISADDSE